MAGTIPGMTSEDLAKFTGSYPFCSNFQHWIRGLALPVPLILGKKTGFEVGLSKRAWPRSISVKLPTLRFRGKVMLGFAVVLAINVASMGIAYLGCERVSTGVASYRNSVSEADLARNIDRELISYQALARYYVVTGKEDDATAALAAETSLKRAIDLSMKGTSNPARLEFVENSLHAISSKDETIAQGLKEATSLLEDYRQALTKLIENSKDIDE